MNALSDESQQQQKYYLANTQASRVIDKQLKVESLLCLWKIKASFVNNFDFFFFVLNVWKSVCNIKVKVILNILCFKLFVNNFILKGKCKNERK